VLVVAIATGLLGATGATITAWLLAYRGLSHSLAEILVAQYDADEATRCQADPAHWQLTVSPGARAFGYDDATLASANPHAPPLRSDLYAKLPAGEGRYAVGMNRHRRGVVVVLRTHASGRCGVIQLASEPALSSGDIVTAEVTGALVIGFACCFLAVLAVGVPLARRIHRLRLAAGRVGDADYQPSAASAASASGDEIDDLGRALDTAHARIRADASLLEHQRNALERHLVEIAHDLRTPLTSLQAALERASDTPSAVVRGELLAGALFDVVYLTALTDNLRLASQLRDAGELARGVLDLGELVERIAIRVRMLARRRSVSLEMELPDAPLLVHANAVAVEQALTNILQNAVAYGDHGGHVAIIVRDDRAGFAIDVRDDGPGVPPPELPRLGRGTFRSDEARQRDPRGRGVGLVITAEVCRRLGWTLSFHALAPRGLGVRICGPLARERES
jgi:signal transduction histidine kinase